MPLATNPATPQSQQLGVTVGPACKAALESRRPVGLPYGTYPRLILAYLTTQAVRSKSSEIELGRTPNDFARRLGLTPISGPRGTTTRLQDQLHRLSSTRLSWQTTKDFQTSEGGSGFIAAADSGLQHLSARLLRHSLIWNPALLLSRDVSQEITRSAVPVDLRRVLLAYPTARVAESDAGLRLYPSLPHIQARSRG